MAGSIYDNFTIGSALGGGTPAFEMNPAYTRFAVNPEVLPTPDKRLGDGPVQQSGPAQVVSPIARILGGVNDKMANYGALLNKPGVAQALAMAGQLMTGAGGKGLLANDVSTLATNLAAGKGVGVGTQPTLPGVIPTNPQQPAQQPATQTPAQVSQTAPAGEPTTTVTRKYDVNGDGVVTNDEIKYVNSGGALTRVGTELLNHPTLGAGSQAGMPVAAPQAPAQLNRNDNLMMLSGLTNPNFALEVAKQEPVATAAAAQMLEAQYKNAMLAPTYAKMAAEANKINWEMSPDYIQFQGALEAAKKEGNLAAERYNLEQLAKVADQQTFNHPLFGKMTGGQIIRMTGVTNPAAITALMTTATSLKTAEIGAGATIGAAKIRAAGEVDAASIAATKTILANQIAMINQAKGMVTMLGKERLIAEESRWPELDRKIQYWQSQADINAVNHANTLKLLEGGSAPANNPPPPKVGAKVTIRVNGKEMKGEVTAPGVVKGEDGKEYKI